MEKTKVKFSLNMFQWYDIMMPSASVVNYTIVPDPTIWFDLPRQS